MSQDSTYVPASCRVGPSLNIIHEVQQSKEFTDLNAQLNAFTNTVQLGYPKLAKQVHKLNTKALHKKVLDIYSTLLYTSVKGFITQYDIMNYIKHQAVLDLLALKTIYVTLFLKTDICELLKNYKVTHKLVLLPTPTVT